MQRQRMNKLARDEFCASFTELCPKTREWLRIGGSNQARIEGRRVSFKLVPGSWTK